MTPSGSRLLRSASLLAIALLVVGCDQFSKYQAVAQLTASFDAGAANTVAQRVARFMSHRHPSRRAGISVIDGFWDLHYVENPSAAFSLLRGVPFPVRWGLLVALNFAALALMCWYFRRLGPERWLARLAVALLMAGGIGNQIDRVRLGYVIDFVRWHWYDSFSWPLFNMADVALVLGGLVLLIAAARYGPKLRTVPAK